MKILIHSNGPNIPTGYGVQVGLLAKRLQAAGHDVAFSAYYGQQHGIGEWEGMTVYPVGFDAYSNDLLHDHALHHFGGDPLGGWIITLMDVFGITTPVLTEFNVLAWCPVDHFPVPPDVLKFFKRTGATPIAMSKFGEESLRASGLDPLYAPLAIDTNVFKPTPELAVEPADAFGYKAVGKFYKWAQNPTEAQRIEARELLGLEADQFVVMMNGMNKGNVIPRKGFPHAFLAFADFAKRHPDAMLYLHTEMRGGAGGNNLLHLATFAGIPEHQIRFCDQYGYRIGMPAPMLAAAYTAADVLLAPSLGEGFCVPLIEAQACGTPVIVTDFSAQPELVGAGWKVTGEPWWEEAQGSWMISPSIAGVVKALDDAYDADRDGMVDLAIDKAREYDADLIFEKHWKPILAKIDNGPVPLDREPIPTENGIAVLVPVLTRPENVAPLVESFDATNDGSATLYFLCDPDDTVEIEAVKAAGAQVLISDRGPSFPQKINSGYEQTLQPWLFVTGDDVRFHDGWIEAARDLSDRFDVIGTNDHPTGEGNPRVKAGAHADHFFIRREYVDVYGGCLGGTRVMHEGYRHFFSDIETVELAKVRRVWTPCLDSLVEHLHPDLGKADVDDVYRQGWEQKERDAVEWQKRAPLVAMQREGLGK